MHKIHSAITAVAALLSLSACTLDDGVSAPADSIKTPIVEMVRLPLAVAHEQDGTADLSPYTVRRVLQFLDQHHAGYGDAIIIDINNETDSPRAIKLASIIKQRGLSFAGIQKQGSASENSMTLYIERHIAIPPACGRWTTETGRNAQNNPSAHHGCANKANLALMVAAPRDLVAGQSSAITSEKAVKAVSDYKTGSTSGNAAGNPAAQMLQAMMPQGDDK